jgi:hypothetical protein
MVKLFKPLMLAASAATFFGSFVTVQSAEYPKAGVACATLATQGCWTWYHDPRAVYYKGTKEKTYVGYFHSDNNPGEASIASYDHSNGTIQTFDLKGNFGFDDHNTTSLHVLPNGKILTMYSTHYGTALYSRTSTNPEDISAWDAEKTAFSGTCTYPNICQLSDEANKLYCFFRGPTKAGVNYDAGQPHFITSTDNGATWSSAIRYFEGLTGASPTTGLRPYCKYVSNGKDKIYMLIERDNRNNAPSKPTYIMYYYNNGFYRMDGTLIKTVAQATTTAITAAEIDVVFDPDNFPDVPGTIVGTGWDIALDNDGYPVFVYDVYQRTTGQDHRYFYFRWDGTKFNHYFLINSGAPMAEPGAGENGFAGGLILDHENPNIVYLSAQVNGVFELQRWVTSDKGRTWKIWQITSGSAAKNCRPIVPRNTPGGKIDVVWNYGTYTSWGGPFNMDVKMYTFDSTKIADGVTPIKSGFERRAPKESGINLLAKGLSFTLVSPASSKLAIFNARGRLIADLSADVRRMNAGVNTIQYKALGLSHGAYIARLFDGRKNYTQNCIVQ